jgi:hypothetical protein
MTAKCIMLVRFCNSLDGRRPANLLAVYLGGLLRGRMDGGFCLTWCFGRSGGFYYLVGRAKLVEKELQALG